MTIDENKLYLSHILEAIEYIEQYLAPINEDTFLKSVEKQDAVIRRFEIIGEAVKNLTPKLRERHQEVDWRQATGMRDRMTHGYFEVDLRMVWATAKDDLPKMKKQATKILKEL